MIDKNWNFDYLINRIEFLHETELESFLRRYEGPVLTMHRLFLVCKSLDRGVYPILGDICREVPWRKVGKMILRTKPTCDAILSLYKIPAPPSFNYDGRVQSPRTLYDVVQDLTVDLDFVPRQASTAPRKIDVRKINNSFRDVVTSDPLWATLGHQPLSSKHSPAFGQLQAQTLVSLVALQGHPSYHSISDLKISVLAMVRSAANDRQGKLLSQLTSETVSPEAYLDALRRSQCPEVVPLCDLIDEALDYLHHAHEPTTKLERKWRPEAEPDLPEIQEPYDDDPEGVVPGEGGVDALPAKRTGGIKDHRAAAQIAKSLAKAAQLFSYSYAVLSRDDLSRFLNSLAPVPDDDPQLALHAQLLLMFWVGFDAQRVSKVVVGDSGLAVAYPEDDIYDPATNSLSLFSPFPELSTEPSQNAQSQLQSRGTRVDLPLPSCCTQVLNDLVGRREVRPGQRLFRESGYQDIQLACRRWVVEHRQGSGSLTVNKIQSYLFQRMSRFEAADPAVAMLVLGRAHRLGQVKVHYLSVCPFYAMTLYQAVVHTILVDAAADQPQVIPS